MYESQVSEYKYEIERLARELQDVKKKYFMQKKKEQQTKYVHIFRIKFSSSIIKLHFHFFMATFQKKSISADPGFPRGANPRAGCANQLFGKMSAKNCMKMKEIGPSAHS